MAEIAVNIVIDKLIPLLTDELTLMRGVHGQITYIKDHLRLLGAYLKDADEKAEMADTSNLVKEWVKQMREVAYRIEDVIDKYLFKVAKHRRKHGLFGVPSKIVYLLRSIIPRHEIASEIGAIRESIMTLDQRSGNFRFVNIPSAPKSSNHGGEITRNFLRLGAHFMDDDQLVGVEHTRKVLTNWLLNEENRRTVISVIGEGGLGKTTIVKNVYEKQKNERTFECYGWVSVSCLVNEERLLKSMIQSFHEDNNINKDAIKEFINETLDIERLRSKVRECLQGRSYLIVFDDVWDTNFLGAIQCALPNNDKKICKIMITTRDKSVAEFCESFAHVDIHELEPLSPNNALRLFNLKVFQSKHEVCPIELKGLSEGFVKKCDGVPLAIVAIASLLSTKQKNVFEWQRVHNSLRSKLASDTHLKGYYQVLSESYNDLPYHLKFCLLYFSLFPEDYSINCVRLINLWVAEGFVNQQENEDQTLEETAEEYLAELIRRSLVKVSEVYAYGRVQRCRVHDLMHNFIMKKCEELNFCQVKKNERFNFQEWTRRLSIQTNMIDSNVQSTTNYGRVRSCFVFNSQELPKPMVESFLSSFKLLIGLDFEDSTLDYLPEAIGKLLHLKYLNLRNTNIKTIPKFIDKLQNLETLDLKHTLVRELPIEINKLIKLRHLIAYSFHWESYFSIRRSHGVKLKEGIGCLKDLQKLTNVDTSEGDGLTDEMNNLKQIRRLGIMNLRRQNGKKLCNAIEGMQHLCSSDITALDENEVLDLQSLSNPPHNLQRLYLHGRLERLPEWIPKLKNLVRLCLGWSGLTEDPLFILKDLLELVVLGLFKSHEGDEVHFRTGWFKKLKILRLGSLQGLRTLKIDEGALPSLEKLELALCPQMVKVPTDIQNMKNLTHLWLREMPSEFINNMKGESYGILEHIPRVLYTVNGEDFKLDND